jgi:hypothetical protein
MQCTSADKYMGEENDEDMVEEEPVLTFVEAVAGFETV